MIIFETKAVFCDTADCNVTPRLPARNAKTSSCRRASNLFCSQSSGHRNRSDHVRYLEQGRWKWPCKIDNVSRGISRSISAIDSEWFGPVCIDDRSQSGRTGMCWSSLLMWRLSRQNSIKPVRSYAMSLWLRYPSTTLVRLWKDMCSIYLVTKAAEVLGPCCVGGIIARKRFSQTL